MDYGHKYGIIPKTMELRFLRGEHGRFPKIVKL